MRHSVGSVFAIVLLIIANGRAQEANSPHFDVVSIKSVDPRVPMAYTGGPGSSDPGRIAFSRISIRRLIASAYVKEYQDRIIGPSSLDSEYTITATLPRGTTDAQLDLMLRNMLSERFGLIFHESSKEVSGFELRVAAGGSKLTPAVEDPTPTHENDELNMKLDAEGFPRVARFDTWKAKVSGEVERVTFKGCAMLQFAHALGTIYTHNTIPFVDKTGLSGRFDFRVELPAPEPSRRGPGGGPVVTPEAIGASAAVSGLSRPLKRQLGLTLRAAQLQQSYLVVDRVFLKPLEN